MAHRILISDGLNAQEVVDYKVAQGGIVKPLVRALAVGGGAAHEYWPIQGAGTDPDIGWDQQPLTVQDYTALTNQPSQASINFLVNGSYNYTNDSSLGNQNTGNATWLDTPVTAAGQYIVKATLVNGTGFGGDALGVWLDMFTARSFHLARAVIGVESGALDITIAKDAGGGVPLAGTEIAKPITFIANIVDEATDVIWSNLPAWNLEEITQEVDATCELNVWPNGVAYGLADTSGSFVENWHANAPNPAGPENYTVAVNVVSGTAPTGPTFNVRHILSVGREWELLATIDENFSCVLDVEIGDGAVFQTKRVTMHSQRETIITSDLVWTSNGWTLVGIAFDPDNAVCTIGVSPDGTAFGDATGQGTFNEDWNSDAPAATDGNDYEAKLVVSSGESPDAGSAAVNTWHRLNFQRLWTLTVVNIAGPIETGDAIWLLSIRKVGGVAVTKTLNIQLNTESVGP